MTNQASCFARIYESDRLIPNDISTKLKVAVSQLEDVPEEQKDWHPRSNGLVLDLVHPSLYCLVYDRTKSISAGDPTKLESIQPPASKTSALRHCENWAFSKNFAWIPTDFEVAPDGSSTKAKSYINNLQKHQDMYPVIEELVARFISLFNRVLTDSHPDNKKFAEVLRITGYYTVDQEVLGPEPEWDGEDDGPWSQYRQRREEHIIPPTVKDKYKEDISQRRTQYSLNGRTIQVIVKLANIHLVRCLWRLV